MASEVPPAAKKIKRTSFSPWNAGGGGSRSAPKKEATNPEPARIVSDILARANGGNPYNMNIPAGLSEHPKILEMQREWERKKKALEMEESGGDARAGSAGTENSVGSEAGGRGTPADRQGNASSKRESSSEVKPNRPTAPSLRPPPNHALHKRPLVEVLAEKALEQELIDAQIKQATHEPFSSTSDAPKFKASTDDIKAHARRFTEEAVIEQMTKLKGKSHKKGGRQSSGTNRPSMSFPTPTELVQQMRNSPAMSAADVPAKETPVYPPKNGDRLNAIALAEDGRLYAMYPKSDGNMESGRGCLFPAHYKHNDNPAYQFICPVRSCRRVFATLKSLGAHFSAGHCSTTYNDNGDGTLSKVGSYVKQGPGGSPGIVISKVTLGPDAPPLAEPRLPLVQRTTSFDSSFNGTPSVTEEGNLTRAARAAHGASSDVYKYLHEHLHPAQLPFERDDINYMTALPRLRNLPDSWIAHHRGSRLDMPQYSCALAFLVGREVTGKAQCQAHIRNGPRPTCRLSVPCIALPYGLGELAKSIFSSVPTCVGCKYWSALQRRSNTCDWSGQDFKPRGISSASAPASGAEEISDDVQPMDVDEDDDTDTDTDSDSEPEVQPAEVLVTKTLRERKRKHHEVTPTTVAHPVIRQQSLVQANVPSRPMGNADLEMEEWEVAPGRMRDEDGAENIAFSNSYLTSGNPIVVSEDVSFNVLVLKPGSVSHWTVENDKLRTCSVASGKIKVTMGEKAFQLGPNGMFLVRPGQTCRVENRIYLDSVVHCTTIADFETQ